MSRYCLYENPFCDLKHKHDQCEFDSIANEKYTMLVIMELIFHIPVTVTGT